MEIDFEWLEKELGLECLKEDHRQALKEALEIVYVPAGMAIIHQGMKVNSLYILRSGSVNIARKTEAGYEIPLARSVRTKVIGETSFFTGNPATATVTADQACILYKLDRKRCHNLMQNHPDLAMQLMALVVRNMGEIIQRLDSQQAHLH